MYPCLDSADNKVTSVEIGLTLLHRSAITLEPQVTGEVNNIVFLVTMAPVSGLYYAASEHFVLEVDVLKAKWESVRICL